jgi:hypothetical protein
MDRDMFERLKQENLFVFLGLSAILLASFLLPIPASDGEIANVPDLCPFYRLTGLPCPFCGLTRAFVCLGHGRGMESLHWHPIGWLVYGSVVFFWARAGATLARGRRFLPIPPPLGRALSSASLAGFFLVDGLRIFWLTAHHLAY